MNGMRRKIILLGIDGLHCTIMYMRLSGFYLEHEYNWHKAIRHEAHSSVSRKMKIKEQRKRFLNFLSFAVFQVLVPRTAER